MTPRLLDLFCGAGGCSVGYSRAGFEVTGVDINPKLAAHYPFDFHAADALAYLAEHGGEFDAIHASPPCRDHTSLTSLRGKVGTGWLLAATREALVPQPAPWVIENVPGADMRPDYRLCGCQFALPGLRRERWFETSWHGLHVRAPCHHVGRTITVTGHTGGSSTRDGTAGFGSKADWERAMGIDWMTARELAQAVPPAYTQFIGIQLMGALTAPAPSALPFGRVATGKEVAP